MPDSPLQVSVTIEADRAGAVQRLAEASELSRGRIKDAMAKGAVWLTRGRNTRRLRRATIELRRGDVVHLHYDPAVLATEPTPPTLVADEGAYSVWHKPFGMLSQGSRWGDHCTINRWCERHLEPERPAFAVHRLDRAATGLMIVAHGKGTADDLSRLFREREIEKRYRVIVHGAFPLGAAPRIIDAPIEGRAARSHAVGIAHDPALDRSLLEVRIETGRKHQIRRHLAGIGHPVLGDRVHGREGDDEDLQLTACVLAFRCPVSGTARRYELPASLVPSLAPPPAASPGASAGADSSM